MDKLRKIIQEVEDELFLATTKFGTFNSPHEGYAVILEELDELWREIKKNNPLGHQRAEAVQVAAMAIRYICDICERDEGG